jgi:hypothetical protein
MSTRIYTDNVLAYIRHNRREGYIDVMKMILFITIIADNGKMDRPLTNGRHSLSRLR